MHRWSCRIWLFLDLILDIGLTVRDMISELFAQLIDVAAYVVIKECKPEQAASWQTVMTNTFFDWPSLEMVSSPRDKNKWILTPPKQFSPCPKGGLIARYCSFSGVQKMSANMVRFAEDGRLLRCTRGPPSFTQWIPTSLTGSLVSLGGSPEGSLVLLGNCWQKIVFDEDATFWDIVRIELLHLYWIN